MNGLTTENRDPQLWKQAQARASFKSHFVIYLVLSVVFWAIWYATGGSRYNSDFPWPVWPMFGWGIGVLFHYVGAYVTPKNNSIEKEYQKLVQQKSSSPF